MNPAFTTSPLGGVRTKHVQYVGLRPSSTCTLPKKPPTLTTCAKPRMTPTARIFDWKKRNDPDYGKLPEDSDGIFRLNNLRPAPGSKHRKKRKGRGHAAGQGGSCGFGMRGQKSRSGRSVRPGFEGGQTPLYRRLPKYVGRPMGPGHKKTEYALIKIDYLNGCEKGQIVTFEGLREKGLMTKQKRKIYKVVSGKEELAVSGLTVKAHAFTTSAVEAIEGAGGTCVLISPTTGKDLVMEDEEQEQVNEVEETGVSENNGAVVDDDDEKEDLETVE